jgi:hypothetical protein
VLVDEDAERWLNFLGPSAAASYAARRTAGWGVDPVRWTKYLTSSQTLTFNMLSEVVRRPQESARLFGDMLGRTDLAWLESADFEFSGTDTSYWLGDRTLVDLLLRFKRTDGGRQDEGAVLLMLLHPGDQSGLNHAQAYVMGLSAGLAAVSAWDVFLRAAGSASAMDGELRRAPELRYVDMSLSEKAWRDLRLQFRTGLADRMAQPLPK